MKRALALLVLALWWGCAGVIPQRTVDVVPEQQRSAYAAALAKLERDPAAGEADLQDFVRSWPNRSSTWAPMETRSLIR